MRFLLCALLASGMAACSDDGPDSNAPTEGYLRAFVKEFGVPADGHDFSMARSAGLTVKASRPTHILVTAVYEGEEYLFGNLNVSEGTTRVPVTIPSDITSLYVSLGMQKYEVAADGLIDLDNLPDPVENPESRKILVDKLQSNGVGRIVATSDPILAFKYDEWLKDYFDEFPIGVDKPAVGISDREPNWDGEPQPYGETNFGRLHETDKMYVFPIYWRKPEDISYKVLLTYIHSGFRPTTTGMEILNSWGTPDLGYSMTQSNKNTINWETLTGFNFDDGSFNEAYPISDDTNPLVVSKGCLIDFSDKQRGDIPICFSTRWLSHMPSSSNPLLNVANWKGSYYKSTIDGIGDAVSSTRRIQLPPTEFTIYDEETVTTLFSDHALLIGFNSPPTKPNDDCIRDYADVLLLLIPKNGIQVEFWSGKNYPKFSWTIAAEDLGGSFDWDFNDAVFTFTDVIETLPSVNDDSHLRALRYGGLTDAVAVRTIEVEPLAAGGTMPLYITYTGRLVSTPELPSSGDADYYTVNEAIRAHMSKPTHEGTYVIGTEIHKWLGASTHTRQINTDATVERPAGKKVKFSIPYDDDPANFTFTVENAMSAKNQPMHGFAVLVDHGNQLNIDAREGDGFAALPGYNLGEGSYLIGRPDENEENVAPQMILLTGSKWEWPRECVNIKEAYPNFSGWVGGFTSTSYKNWHTSSKKAENVTKR